MTTTVLIRRLETHLNDLRRAVIGKGRVKKSAGPIHRNTVIFRNSWLRKQVSLPHPRTPIARRRLNFLGSILRKDSQDLVAWLVNSKFTGEHWESAKGGRFASHWLRCLKSDIEWLSGIIDIRALQLFINYCATSDSQAHEVLTLAKRREPKWMKYTALFEGFTSVKSLIKSMEKLGAPHRQTSSQGCGVDRCVWKFAERKELYRHVREKHMSSDENVWLDDGITCPEVGCNAHFKKTGWLKFHLHLAHRSKIEDYQM